MRRELRAARDSLTQRPAGTSNGAGSGSGDGNGNGDRPVTVAEFPGLPAPPSPPPPRTRPRLKKLRLVIVMLGLALLAFVSWIFGIMMAVAQDLPKLENRQQYLAAKNSRVFDRYGEYITTLTGNENRILIESSEISPTVKQAVVSIEDERFYDHRGVDAIGIARAVIKDVIARDAVQGASTITQQFVKNALEAQQSRTFFQKLRESALAYHLEREWSKDKILTQYLNSIYFGEGAYGIEAAAKTYFSSAHPGCGGKDNRCAAQLLPHEAALLAGIISSPEAYSPRANPDLAEERRDIVLQKMLEQGAITQDQYDDPQTGTEAPLPAPSEITPPKEESAAPYFTSWLRQQVVDHYGAGQAFGGGLQIQSTLDLELQQASQQAVYDNIGGIGPTASVVVMDNATGGVLAMVGGEDYEESPFNLATNGHRQPGSAIKPFTLVTALEQGTSTASVWTSAPKEFPFRVRVEKNGKERTYDEVFSVDNYGDSYLGAVSLFDATTNSDNSVYSELGLQVGLENVAATARKMGIQTDLATDQEYSIDGAPFTPYNPALTLGGLEEGVTPLEMTHAYLTLARDGLRVSGSLASSNGGPLGISTVKDQDSELLESNDGATGQNKIQTERVISPETAVTAKSVLESVVSDGTGVRAQYGGYAWGKTGTTENNGDAWFCGANEDVTACVWVGHPDGNTPMETEYAGEPVDGGTYPALIWADVIAAYEALMDERKAAAKAGRAADEETIPTVPTTTPVAPVAPAPTEAPAPVPEEEAIPEEQTPAEPLAPAPAPPPATEAPGAGGVDG